MKICFFCIGSGETSQAVAVCKVARAKGHSCVLIATNESGSTYAKSSGIETVEYLKWPIRVGKKDVGYNPNEAKEIIEQSASDALVICNSKATSWGFITKRPNIKKIYSIDSNWLFSQYKDVQVADWIDTYFVTFPEKVFQAGLKGNGGPYTISKKILEKICPVGFVPSVKKVSESEKEEVRARYGSKYGEKLVFMYCGWDEEYTQKLIVQYAKAIKGINGKRRYEKIKIVYAGKTDFKLDGAYCDNNYLKNPSNFQLVLSASDLVVAHQGMITLFQSIGAAVPIISNVPGKGKYHSGEYHTSYYETKILSSLNLCVALERFQSDEAIGNIVEKILFEKEARAKIVNAQNGMNALAEENIVNYIENNL